MSMFVLAFSVFFQPFIRNVYVLNIVYFVQGFGQGFGEVGSNIAINYLWGKRLNVPIQILHFAYGFGSLIFPLIVAQLLSISGSVDVLFLSFLICCLIVLFNVFLLILFPSPTPYDKYLQTIKNGDGDKERKSRKSLTVISNLYLFLVSSFFTFYAAAEITYVELLVYFFTESKLDNDVGANITSSIFFLFFTLGRVIGVFESLFIPLWILLSFNLSITLFSTIILAIFQHNLWMIRAYSAVLGFFFSLIYPSNYSLPKTTFGFEITGIGTASTLVGASIGLTFPSLIKYLMSYDVGWFFYGIIIFVSVSIVLFLLEMFFGVLFLISKKKKKLKIVGIEEEKQEDNSTLSKNDTVEMKNKNIEDPYKEEEK